MDVSFLAKKKKKKRGRDKLQDGFSLSGSRKLGRFVLPQPYQNQATRMSVRTKRNVRVAESTGSFILKNS